MPLFVGFGRDIHGTCFLWPQCDGWRVGSLYYVQQLVTGGLFVGFSL